VFSHVARISFVKCEIVDRDVLSDLDRINSLGFSEMPLRDSILSQLTRMPRLTELALDGCGLTDLDIQHLSGAQRLERLYLRNSPKITARCLTRLNDLPSLEHFEADISLDEQALVALGRFPSLKNIPSTNGVDVWFDDITDAGLRCVTPRNCPTFLVIRSAAITDHGLAALVGCSRLEHLQLHGVRMTDDGMRTMVQLSGLKRLLLYDVPITDAGLRHLRNLPQLKIVRFVRTKVTPEGLRAFAEQFPDAMVDDRDPLVFARP
jgi:Leucine-rich repeat (LRR) protein